MAHHRADPHALRRRLAWLTGVMTALLLTIGGTAVADPDFGPGNSGKGPHDPGALCHPPGQTDTFPACK